MANTREDYRLFTVKLPRIYWVRLKKISAEKNHSLSDLIEHMTRDYLTSKRYKELNTGEN